jgi:predicted RNase H-like HicB family nuclease
MKYAIVLEKGPKSWGAYVPDLPGCVAVGESRQEVRKLIREAIDLHLESLKESGIAIPDPHSEAAYIEVAAV